MPDAMIAIYPPIELAHNLARMIELNFTEEQTTEVSGADDIHLTMLYLGEVQDANLKEIKEEISNVARGFKPVRVHLANYGIFRKEDQTISILKCSDPGNDLLKIHMALKSSIPNGHSFVFQPHITLAYMKPGITYPKITGQSIPWPDWITRYLVLVTSNKNPQGKYENISTTAVEMVTGNISDVDVWLKKK